MSEEMKAAIALVATGVPVREAARTAGVHYTGLHRQLAKIKEGSK